VLFRSVLSLFSLLCGWLSFFFFGGGGFISVIFSKACKK